MGLACLEETIVYRVGRPRGSKTGVKTQREPNFVCEYCGKTLYMPHSILYRHGRKRRFCSRKCKDIAYLREVRQRKLGEAGL